MIRLHLFDLDRPPVPITELRATLDASESDRADRFRRDLDRDRYTVGRGLLRLLLGQELGVDAADVPLGYGPHGKPRLSDARLSDPGPADPGPASPTFGVSHCDNLLALAIATPGVGEVGVDAELVRPLAEPREVAARVFDDAEAARVATAAEAGDWAPFHRQWTAKEAALKALGTGFSLDPAALRVVGDGTTSFGVEPAGEPVPGLPVRGIWVEVAPLGRPADTGAIVALVPVGPDTVVEISRPAPPASPG